MGDESGSVISLDAVTDGHPKSVVVQLTERRQDLRGLAAWNVLS